MLKRGDEVDDFKGVDDKGQTVQLSSLLDKGPVVLFFYPAAMTYGCTIESCHFRDLAAEFTEVGAQRVGISADSVNKQAKFSEKHSFDYPLIADEDKSIAKIFGVTRIGPLPNRRVTFVIGTDRRIVETISSETKMNSHADQALETLRQGTKV
ncbi:MAG: thioredoxin-dependent peroxiredoxin [Frankiales bacterium]|nr:thioredoxin-dependent peroxiredoxin [Frankiales bacterium]